MSAALTPGLQGNRRLQLEARKVLLDDLLALRMSETRLRSDTLVSASIDSDIRADGTPQTMSGSILAQGGSIGDPADPEHQIPITSAEFGLDWDISRRTLARAVQGHGRRRALHAALRICRARRSPAATGSSRSAAAGSCSIR